MFNELEGAKIITPHDIYKPKQKLEPIVDELISKIVGQKIFQRDPRLISYIIRWKKNKPVDSMEPDNYLKNTKFIEGLKKELNISL